MHPCALISESGCHCTNAFMGSVRCTVTCACAGAAPPPKPLACAAAGLTYAYYRQKSYREFGGITGDLAGYFVTLCEGVMAVLVAAAGLIG